MLYDVTRVGDETWTDYCACVQAIRGGAGTLDVTSLSVEGREGGRVGGRRSRWI